MKRGKTKMKNLIKKIGIVGASAFLLASCGTQKYSTMEDLHRALNEKEYAITQEVLKKERPILDSLETRYNVALENKKNMPYSEFAKIMGEYFSQKSKVQKYEIILELNEEGKNLEE
jgi:hypothetical protein